jgi:hypothetical protein
MKKIVVTKITGEIIHNTELPSQEWLDREIRLNSWGKPARWLPDFLEGAETKTVIDSPYVAEYTTMQMLYSETGEELGEIPIIMPEQPEVSHTEYLHPAEYSYEIIEESLEVVKARKLAELSAKSIAMNDELKAWNEYRASNILAGIYDEAKAETYRLAYKAKSELLRNKYYELKALVENASTEEEVNSIQFSVE